MSVRGYLDQGFAYEDTILVSLNNLPRSAADCSAETTVNIYSERVGSKKDLYREGVGVEREARRSFREGGSGEQEETRRHDRRVIW